MSISAIKTGVTYAAVTGGTSVPFTLEQQSTNSSSLFGVLTDAFSSRKKLAITNKMPKASVSAPGGSTQARHTAQFIVPKTLANGKITNNTIKIEISFDPETTDAEKAILELFAVQYLGDSTFADLRRNQVQPA